MLAGRPALRGQESAACFQGRGLELGRHRVVEAIVEAVERDDGDDLDDLRLREMLLERGEVGIADGVWHLRRAARDGEGGAFGGAEQRARLVLPECRLL